MYPAFDVGDQLAVEKVTKRTRPLALAGARSFERNEVVVFNPPPAFQDIVDSRARNEALIKRIVAVAGDTVAVEDGVLYVNGKPQAEPFENEKPNYAMPARTVPPDCVFVLGDNRNQSLDGHVWGFLPVKNIIGRAVFKYWPPSAFGAVDVPVGNY
jgi:signal peptidase I